MVDLALDDVDDRGFADASDAFATLAAPDGAGINDHPIGTLSLVDSSVKDGHETSTLRRWAGS